MKRLVLAIFLLAAVLPHARAQDTDDDQYIIIYSLIQQADSLADDGQPNRALSQYVEAQGELEKFQKIYPDWNPNIVNFRLNYLAEKISEMTAQIPATNSPPQIAAPTNSTSTVPTANSFNANLDAELNSLRAQMQNLQNENTTLEAKLKEALSAQPAIIDSRELSNAREQIRSLMKQNDLLKVELLQRRGTFAGTQTNELAQARAALADANKNLTAQMERVNQLTVENQSLQARVQSLLASPAAMDALRAENEFLKKELADARAQISSLQSQVQV